MSIFRFTLKEKNNEKHLEQELIYSKDGQLIYEAKDRWPTMLEFFNDKGWLEKRMIFEDGKSASELSRKDEIFESQSGLISIAGGKLTGYRKMSERIVDLVAKRMENRYELEFREVQTENILNNEIMISSGLNPGEIIATAGVNYLQDGQTVKLLDKHVQQYN